MCGHGPRPLYIAIFTVWILGISQFTSEVCGRLATVGSHTAMNFFSVYIRGIWQTGYRGKPYRNVAVIPEPHFEYYYKGRILCC